MGLNVLGCRADILETNCNKLLKLKINVWGGRWGGGSSASVRVAMSGGRGGGSKAPSIRKENKNYNIKKRRYVWILLRIHCMTVKVYIYIYSLPH